MPEKTSLDTLIEELREIQPYPGLRPFLQEESHFFKGRDTQVREINELLTRQSCVAVLGGSGCGKSSIVLAGVIPALRLKQMPGRGDFWRVAICNPGREPFKNLMAALTKLLEPSDDVTEEKIREILYGSDGLGGFLPFYQKHVLLDPGLSPEIRERANLLIIIDQFEELFRDENRGKAEIGTLVRLIVDFWRKRENYPGLYLVLTMRSDDLHRCAEFINLPDVINATGYLTRRLKEDELREAIVTPVRPALFRAGLLEGALAPGEEDLRPFDVRVVTELLDSTEEIAHDPDHLPLLQHLLAVLWRTSLKRWREDEAAETRITLQDLAKTLGFDTWADLVQARDQAYAKDIRGWLLRYCLEHVGEELYAGDGFGPALTPSQQAIAETAFCLMGEVDDRGNFKRRWTSRQEIARVAGLAEPNLDLDRFIQHFTEDHRLILDRGGTLDVSHESLMRNWKRLADWLINNKEAGAAYNELVDSHEKWKQHNRNILQWLTRQIFIFRYINREDLFNIQSLLIRSTGLEPRYNEFWAGRFIRPISLLKPDRSSITRDTNLATLRDDDFNHRFDFLRKRIRNPILLKWFLVLVLSIFAIVFYRQHQDTLDATKAKEKAEYLKQHAEEFVGFLVGEQLIRELRDSGLSNVLQLMQEQSDKYLKFADLDKTRGSAPQVLLLTGLAKRNKGDLERIHGNINSALDNFGEAKAIFSQNNEEYIQKELARTLSRIGDALTDKGRPNDALSVHKEALQIRKNLHQINPKDDNLTIELAESHRSVGALQSTLASSSESKQKFDAAVSLAFEVISKAKTRSPSNSSFSNPLPTQDPVVLAAKKLLADTILNKSFIDFSPELSRQAMFLAEENVWDRPLSAEARQAEAVALLQYSSSEWWNYSISVSENLEMNRKTDSYFEELSRWDPSNNLWFREKLATHLKVAEGILSCLDDSTCQKKSPKGLLSEAESLALESVTGMRGLVAKDPDNISWKGDLAWALTDWAKVMIRKQQESEGVKAFEDAIRLLRQVAEIEPQNADAKWSLALTLRDRANAFKKLKKENEALTDQQDVRRILEEIVKAHPEAKDFREQLRITLTALRDEFSEPTAAESLKKLQDISKPEPTQKLQAGEIWLAQKQKAEEAKKRNDWDECFQAYREGIESLKRNVSENPEQADGWNELGVAHNQLGVAFYDHGQHKDAINEFHAALEPYQRAQRIEQTKTDFLDNERNAYDWIILIFKEMESSEPQQFIRSQEQYEEALNNRLSVFNKKVILTTKQDKADAYHNLAIARRDLAKFLAFNKNQSQEATELMEETRADMERLIKIDPANAAYHCRLGDAIYAIGLLRREMDEAGVGMTKQPQEIWEETIRLGLANIDHGIELNPKEFICQKFSGGYRKYLGRKLKEDDRVDDAKKILNMALNSSKTALKLSPNDTDIQRDIVEIKDLLSP